MVHTHTRLSRNIGTIVIMLSFQSRFPAIRDVRATTVRSRFLLLDEYVRESNRAVRGRGVADQSSRRESLCVYIKKRVASQPVRHLSPRPPSISRRSVPMNFNRVQIARENWQRGKGKRGRKTRET